MRELQVSLNGTLASHAEARIHIGSAAMKYGASVFEGVRGYWREAEGCLRVLELEAHLTRLIESMRLMRMETFYSLAELTSVIESLVHANRLEQDCYLRVSASVTGQGGIDTSGPVLLGVVQSPKGRHPRYDSGVALSISAWVRIADAMMPPRLKCIANYQNGRLAKLQAKLDGYDDALLFNRHGYAAETPTACFCVVQDGTVFTPPVSADILPSITRQLLFRIAPAINIRMEERNLTRTDCYLADEAFLCGTGAEILPVASIDRHAMRAGAPGPVTLSLRAAYEAVAYGRTLFFTDPAHVFETRCGRIGA